MAVKVKRPLGTEGSGVWSTPRTIVSRAVRETNRRQDHECRSTVIPTIANVGESAKDPEGKHIYGSYTLRPNVPPAFISRAKQCCLPYSRTALCARTQAAAPHHHIESIHHYSWRLWCSQRRGKFLLLQEMQEPGDIGTHTSGTQYICSLCGRAFHRDDQLHRKHIRVGARCNFSSAIRAFQMSLLCGDGV